MIPAARVAEIKAALATAGPEWPAVAKSIPEIKRVHLGVESGPGLCRPHVWLHDEIEGRPLCPPRIIRYDTATWFLPGERITTREDTTWRPTRARRFGSGTTSGWSGGATT